MHCRLKCNISVIWAASWESLLSAYAKNKGTDQYLFSQHTLVYDFRGDSDCYRIFHTRKLWDMFNEVFQEHKQRSPDCRGRLDFDYATEQQRSLCWREKVVCDQCPYTSQRYNIYDEIETGKPGRKSATANVGLNIGLSQTPIGPSAVRKLCLSSNIPVYRNVQTK